MSDISYSAEHDFYDLLEVAPGASGEEISRAHKRVVKTCHPDLHADQAWATERFKEVNTAYAVLRDPAAKGAYDRLRWAELAEGKAQPPKKHGLFKRPRRSAKGGLDQTQHHKERYMNYFILGIEVLFMTGIFILVAYRAITKHKF